MEKTRSRLVCQTKSFLPFNFMTDVTLNIYSEEETTQVLVEGSKFTIGSGKEADLQIEDENLAPVHASINREGERVWVLDEYGKSSVFVNNQVVSSKGIDLQDNDRLTVGNKLIVVGFNKGLTLAEEDEEAEGEDETATAPAAQQTSSLRYLAMGAGATVLAVTLVGGGIFIATRKGADNTNQIAKNNVNQTQPTPEPDEDPSPSPSPVQTQGSGQTPPPPSPSPLVSPTPIGGSTTYKGKLYKQMTPDEQNAFIKEKAKEISRKMSNTTYNFTDEVVPIIKQYVDGFSRRVGNGSTKLWGEDTNLMFLRAQKYAPYITAAFNEKGIPPVVGLYLVVVETEYHNIRSENFAGAAGLFQFICPTAKGYGVACEDRTNVEKMAPAAAGYLSDRISEFGVGPMSVALSIAGYNRSPDSVRRDLHDVINSDNKERTFWNLVANSTKLDHWFQGENIKYVPKYFGAAIVGENPQVFGLDMPQPLSTFVEKKVPVTEL